MEKRAPAELAETLLRLAQSGGGCLEECRGQLACLGHEVGRRDHAIDEPHARRPLGVDRLPQEQQLAEVAVPQAAQQRRRGQRRHQAAMDLGKADPQVVGGDDEVAAGHQGRAAGVGRLVGSRDGHQRAIAERFQGPHDRLGASSAPSPRAASSRSNPEQKAGPAPRTMTARRRGSAASDCMA